MTINKVAARLSKAFPFRFFTRSFSPHYSANNNHQSLPVSINKVARLRLFSLLLHLSKKIRKDRYFYESSIQLFPHDKLYKFLLPEKFQSNTFVGQCYWKAVRPMKGSSFNIFILEENLIGMYLYIGS